MFEIQSTLMMVISIALFIIKGFAVVDCVARPSARFGHLETLPKQTWLVILLLGLAAHVVWWAPLGLLNLAGTVAALVYLAQVRGSDSR